MESNTNEEKDTVVTEKNHLESSTDLIVEQSESVPMEEDVVTETVKTEAAEEEDTKLTSQDLPQKTAVTISRPRDKSLPRKRGRPLSSGKTKSVPQKHVDIAHVVQLLASKEAQDEILKYEVKMLTIPLKN